MGGTILRGEKENTRKNTCPPQIPHKLALDRNQAFAMENLATNCLNHGTS
jgi:hypothetical protein